MEKISWTDRVRNEEVLLRVNERRNILHEIRKRKTNWIGHILRRNCLLKQVIEGNIKGEMEVTKDEDEDVGSHGMTLRKGGVFSFEGGSSRSHYVEESLALSFYLTERILKLRRQK